MLIAVSYQRFGWAGVALVAGGIVFWMLLHFTRMMTVLKRATNAPMGYVASAVMLNAKLKPGVTLLHVTAMTKSLGLLQSEKGVQPEVYRWTDTGGSHVTGTFVGGKLTQYVLRRPEQAADNS
ncbi:MAG: glycerate kinase [Burkholderiaceae bacterium]